MLLLLMLMAGFIADGCVNGTILSIYPGTLWCTYNKTSVGWDDNGPLGTLENEDACCRQRNRCPWYILPGQCQYDICNQDSYTLFHCACDELFQLCLKKVGTTHAKNIFFKYFDSSCRDGIKCSKSVKCIQV